MIGRGGWNRGAILALLGASCQAPPVPDPPAPGDPLPGLTEAQRGRFLLGRALFERLTTPEEGLGPLFNETRCSSCHQIPATGGSGTVLVTKATRFAGGACDLLEGQGGDNIQQRATPALIAAGITGESLPPGATAHVRVTGPPLFGLGLLEAIPAAAIRAREDPNDADGNGISGRAAQTPDGRLGRFGRKGENETIFDFVETALRFELGLTTPMHPVEETVNGRPIPSATDPMAEPEIEQRGMDLLTDYLRYLAPPSPRAAGDAAERDEMERGRRVFERIGCQACHVSHMETVSSEDPLNGRRIEAYTDLLLHDMGPELADVCGRDAGPSEYRTAPLWGLRFRLGSLLHHGRAATPEEAIGQHGGEGAASRTAFAELDPADQTALLTFLSSR